MHCVAGVSRSASIVCAYLMVHEGLSLEEARKLCKKQRPCTRPNESFLKQLKAWSATLRPQQQATQAVPYSAKENHPAFGHQPPRPFMPPGSEFAAALMGPRSPMRSPTKPMGMMPPQGLGVPGVPLNHPAAMGMGGPFSPPQKMAGKGGGARFF